MTDVITPAAAALCAALNVSPCDDVVSLFYASARGPAETRYESLVGCTHEQFEKLDVCGRTEDCVVVGMYVTNDGRGGFDRLCRKRKGEPVS